MSENDTFGGLLFLLHKNQHKYLNNAFRKFNLNIMQVLFLIRLNYNPDYTQKDLAEWFFLTKGSVAKSLSDLEDKGFIKRERLPDNKRKYKITLSKKSVDLLPEFKKISDDWEHLVGLDKVDENFLKTFKQLTENSIKINKE